MAAKSVQPRIGNTTESAANYIFMQWDASASSVPPWGSPGRVALLREHARTEPILSGAVSSMLAKLATLQTEVVGGRNRVARWRDVLAYAEDGQGWGYFLKRWAGDYFITDIGGVVELAREGRDGPVGALYNFDSATLDLTGDAEHPVNYTPKVTGRGKKAVVPLRRGDYARIVDTPSTDELKFGLGFSAVSRALRVSNTLLALYRYEDEKLSDMPLPGLVTITGMTMDEVKEAMELYKAKNESREKLTFRDVLWLASSGSAFSPIEAKITSFAGLPEAFNRTEVITLYVYTLALDFGVDVREFWPASQTGATKAEAEIQDEKARGKGFGQAVQEIERTLNFYVLPDGIEFKFIRPSNDEDLLRAQINQVEVTTVRSLWEPAGTGAGVITTAEARRWLLERGTVPEWLTPALPPELTVQTPPDGAVSGGQVIGYAQKAAAAGLGPGEDLVVVDVVSGDTHTLWSSRYTSYGGRHGVR